ncbi:MAG TPA: hypothetical protein VFQ61_36580 [Polyangiaceae bacterium]|nr:hypothetical protein [Polyangiaceae bacterium]
MLKQDEQVAEAQRAVEMARAELADSLSTVTENSTAALKNALHKARPVLIGVAALGATVLTVKVLKSLFGSRHSRSHWQPPAPHQPSVIGGIAKSALLSVGSAVVSRMAQRAILKWTENTDASWHDVPWQESRHP